MESAERINSAANYEPIDSKRKFNFFSSRRKCPELCTIPLYRPLRIFQFLTTLLLFALVVYLTTKSKGTSSGETSEIAKLVNAALRLRTKEAPSVKESKTSDAQKSMKLRASKSGQHLTHLASILLITLTSSYLFFMAIDIISQFGYRGLPDSPMFLFSFLGVVLFGLAGGLMIYYRDSEDTLPELIISQVLCFLISALFFIEITMLLAWWRMKCLSWRKCYPYTPEDQRGVKTLFHRDCPCDNDLEAGKNNIATSTSRVAFPLDTDVNSAVEDHGLRKISVGHRREYIDRPSSVPALSSVQIAEIQTETGLRCVTECQTQRTEMRETNMQTSSRCELCNRQMDIIQPLQPSTQLLPQASETMQFNALQPTNQYQFPQQGHCAMCPAFYKMMRGGMASPCCQSCDCGESMKNRQTSHAMEGGMASPCCKSCNCGETQRDQIRKPVPYLLNETPKRQQTEIELAETQQEPQQHLPRTSTNNLASPGTNSPTPMTSDQSDVELRDKVVNEGNRYRPSKKVPRVYETRSRPSHGSGLAAQMAELPETGTRVTLSSISLRRNKRTQTPSKTSASSQNKGDTEKNESREYVDVIALEDTPEDYDHRKEQTDEKQSVTFARRSDTSTSNSNKGIAHEVHKKLISGIELRKRLSEDPRISYVSATKSVIDNQSPKNTTDSLITKEMVKKVGDRGSTEKSKSSGKILYRADRSDPRVSEPAPRDLSWFTARKSTFKEEESEWDVEKSGGRITPQGTDDENQSVVKSEALTSVESELSAIEEENTDSETSTVIKKESGTLSNVRQESGIKKIPVLRLRLDEIFEDFQSSTPQIGESEEMDKRISSKIRSASKDVGSKIYSTDPSRSKMKVMSDDSLGRNLKDSDIVRSPTLKTNAVSQERFRKIDKVTSGSYLDYPGEELEDNRDEFSDDEEKEPRELSAAESEDFVPLSPILRSKSSVSEKISSGPTLRLRPQKSGDTSRFRPEKSDEDFKVSKRQIDKSDVGAASAISTRASRKSELSDALIERERSKKSSRIISSPILKTSAISQRSEKIERDSSDSYPDLSGQDRVSSEQEMSPRSSEFMEKNDDESSQRTDEDLAETIIQEESGAELKISASSRISTAPSIHEKTESPSRSQSENIREDSTTGSKGYLSKVDSKISSGSKTRNDEMSDGSMEKRTSGRGSQIRSPISKVITASQEIGPGEIEKDKDESHFDLSGRQRNFSKRQMSSRSRQFDVKSEGSSDRVVNDSETALGKWSGAASELSSPSARFSSAKQSTNKNVESRSASKFQLEKGNESSRASKFRAESDDLSRIISKSKSASKGQITKVDSAISSSSKTGRDENSEVSISKRRSGQSSHFVGSPTSKASITSQDRSRNIKKESSTYANLSDDQRKFNEREPSSRFRQFGEKSEDESIERNDDEEIENSTAFESKIFAFTPGESRIDKSTDQNIGAKPTSRQSAKKEDHSSTISNIISPGSKMRKDDISEASLRKRSKEGSENYRSSLKIELAVPKSYSDLSDGQRKFSDRATPGGLSEFEEKREEETSEQNESKPKIENLEALESKVFASSSKLTRTSMNQKVEGIKDGIEENVDVPRRATNETSIERQSKTLNEKTSRASREESSGEFIYVPAPWSSDGSVLQRKSRIESVDRQKSSVNPNTELYDPSDDPTATQ